MYAKLTAAVSNAGGLGSLVPNAGQFEVTRDPDEKTFSEFKSHGIKIIYRSLNPTPENSRMAEKFGADMIVATGFNAAFRSC